MILELKLCYFAIHAILLLGIVMVLELKSCYYAIYAIL